jgi:flagellin
VTATVITNGDGSQSLSLNDTAGGGALTVTASGGSAAAAPVLSVPTTPSAAVAIQTITSPGSSPLVGPASGSVNTSDVLTGAITINGDTYTMGTTAYNPSIPATTGATIAVNGDTLADLARAITANTGGVTATASTNGLQLNAGAAITLGANTLSDTTLATPSIVTLGSFASQNDTISGTLAFKVNGGATQSVTATQGETVTQFMATINAGSYGVTASWVAGTNGAGSLELTSNATGPTSQLSAVTSSIADTATTATLTYASAGAYSIGLSSDATNSIYDSTSGQNSTTAAATFATNQKQGSGVAVTSYSDGAGQALNGTDLLNQADARNALTALNLAITAVAAQDGYIGAEINTLNSISQVMSTQQENVVSAQNAVQATDYASATSNMSKYEILSQTGIAALAQANSVQQEVTKLLQ